MLNDNSARINGNLLNGKNWLSACALSLAYHCVEIFILILLPAKTGTSWQFWAFFVSDAVLLTILLLPLVGAWRHQLHWYDPLCWMFILLLGMSGTTLLAYILDPSYVLFGANFGSYIFIGVSESDILLKFTESHIVVAVFSTLVLATNRKFLMQSTSSVSPTEQENKLAVVAAILAVIGGVVGFLAVWSKGSYIDSLVLTTGSNQATALESGSGKFFILQSIAVAAIPLGLIGWFNLRRARGHGNNKIISLLAFGVLFFSLVPSLVFGSRITVLFTIVAALVQLAHFGISFKKGAISSAMILVTVVILAITLLRGNSFIRGSSIDAVMDLESLTEAYQADKGSSVGSLLDLARTAPIALILEVTQSQDAYTHGESLIAGPANLIMSLFAKVTSGSWLQESSYKQANTQISIWRFGQSAQSWAVPPSYPGEFYMQFGYISLVLLSLLFGWFFQWLRRCIWTSRTLIWRWMFILIAVTVAKFVTTEISVIFSYLFFSVLPIMVLYGVASLLIPTYQNEKDANLSQAT